MKTIFSYLLVICLSFSLFSCGKNSLSDRIEISPSSIAKGVIATTTTDKLSEVAPPHIIQKLGKGLEKYQPQVSILNPKKEKIYDENKIEVRLKVKNLPIFKNEEFGLGPHLHLILDNEPDQAIYDTDQPFVLENLAPGTHTLRIFASRPWYESFKNKEAYAQTTFHILTKTNKNNPDSNLPLLAYSRPQGAYGAEPIMLDFYLNQAAQKGLNDEQIRVTVNGESFIVDDWRPLYLEGFKRGNNWVRLELLDREGNQIENAFNNTIRLITYNPETKDTLAKLVTGELSVEEVRGIVEKNYQPKTVPVPEKTVTPVVESPEVELEESKSEVEPEAIEPEIESEIKTKELPESLEKKKKTSKVKPEVKYTSPSVTEELNSVTEELVETKEPSLDVAPNSEDFTQEEKTGETAKTIK